MERDVNEKHPQYWITLESTMMEVIATARETSIPGIDQFLPVSGLAKADQPEQDGLQVQYVCDVGVWQFGGCCMNCRTGSEVK